MKGEDINAAGLFRCCILAIENIGTPAKEGDIALCSHCHDRMTFDAGTWRWLDDSLKKE